MVSNNDMQKIVTSIIALVFIAVVLLLIMPFLQIWAINTLFKTDIEYSWLNWFAAILLNSSVRSINYCGGR